MACLTKNGRASFSKEQLAMALHADAGCINKVSVHSEACRRKAMEVLSSVVGVHSVTIDTNMHW